MSTAAQKQPLVQGGQYGQRFREQSHGRAQQTPAQRRRLIKQARRWAKGVAEGRIILEQGAGA